MTEEGKLELKNLLGTLLGPFLGSFSEQNGSSSSSSVMMGCTILFSIIVSVTFIVSIWISYAKYRWEQSIKSFIQKERQTIYNSSDVDEQKDIILIVNPASGGGKSMKLYSSCLDELVATGRPVQVIITKSSDEMKNLTRIHDMSTYRAIAIMSGDSTITEFVQYELLKNDGKWPYAPILHLPTGTGNAISSEMFAGTPLLSIREIIRHGLSKSRYASVLKVTSPSLPSSLPESSATNISTTRYALHNCFDGIQRHMIDVLEKKRTSLYPAFGFIIFFPFIIYSLFTCPKTMNIPYLCSIITDTEGKGVKLGFDMTRFDDQMVVIYMSDYDDNGNSTITPWSFFRLIMKFLSGQIAKDWKENKLPNYVHIEKTNKYTFYGFKQGTETKGSFNMYLDGSGSLPCRGMLPITFEVITKAIPYFVRDDTGAATE